MSSQSVALDTQTEDEFWNRWQPNHAHEDRWNSLDREQNSNKKKFFLKSSTPCERVKKVSSRVSILNQKTSQLIFALSRQRFC